MVTLTSFDFYFTVSNITFVIVKAITTTDINIFTFIHLAGAFIQSDLQLGNTSSDSS